MQYIAFFFLSKETLSLNKRQYERLKSKNGEINDLMLDR